MKSLFICLIACLAPVIYVPGSCARPLTSLDLINNAKQYDGHVVSYQGEVIGDAMIRQGHAWVNVYDGNAAIGVWGPISLIEDIHYYGDYHKKGDIVEVSGIFHRSCIEHGGDLDIHASGISKISPGNPIVHTTSAKKVHVAISSLMLVLLFYALKFLKKK